MDEKNVSNQLTGPPIQHDVKDPDLKYFLSLPQAKYIETALINDMVQLQAKMMRPIFSNDIENPKVIDWEESIDFQFKLLFSANKKVIRVELYDTLMIIFVRTIKFHVPYLTSPSLN